MRVDEDSLPRIDVHPRSRNESLVAELTRGRRPPQVHVVRGGLRR